jgi:hypothetical protein
LVLEYSHDIFLVLEIILVALETQCCFTLVSSLVLGITISTQLNLESDALFMHINEPTTMAPAVTFT